MSKITEKKFNKNMLIMLVSIMAGAILVTYFAADILRQSKIDDLQGQIDYKNEQIDIKEKEIIEEKNRSIQFTNGFLRSTGELDRAREDRSLGNYHFDLGRLFYSIALSEKNQSMFNSYKNSTIDNCTLAMPNYNNSYYNFLNAGYLFNKTKNFTSHPPLLNLLDKYINLTHSGARLSMLLKNASFYLKTLAESLKMVNNSVIFDGDSEIWDLYNETLDEIEIAEEEYDSDKDDLDEASEINDDEYSFEFNTKREI